VSREEAAFVFVFAAVVVLVGAFIVAAVIWKGGM
jgi:hypothetical protein